MSLLLLGLFSWLLIGLAAGLLAAKLLPGPPISALATAAIGVAGALAGGLLATALGFGGLAGFDLRAFTVATLAAIVALLFWRTAKLS